MKHLQKLPNNPGDSIFLGTVVAVGIQPGTATMFASFEANGELTSYSLDRTGLLYILVGILENYVGDYYTRKATDTFKFRHDLRYERTATSHKIIPVSAPSTFQEATVTGID